MDNQIYMCIDLKTFFASCECVHRGLDPFETNLVVADPSRGNGAICLAISPKLKSQGIRNRCRIYEIPKNIDYITAVPKMRMYMEYAARIYEIYLKYVSKEDIHVYSIDESFLNLTPYLKLYNKTSYEIANHIKDDVLKTTGITATIGLGTNMYLAKIAMDIIAKHVDTHIAYLDQKKYRQELWHHKPLTDFWQIGRGTEKRLAKHGIEDMYGIAHFPEEVLYKEFGINAKYLIDHAWGKEPTTMEEIHGYEPVSKSVSNSQVLFEDYNYKDAYLVLKEMVEINVLTLSSRHLVTNLISLRIGYSKDIQPPTGGARKINQTTNVYSILLKEFCALYKDTTRRDTPIRTLAISFGNIKEEKFEQYDLFTDFDEIEGEKNVQLALLDIKSKYGKNAVLRGMNLCEKATTRKRNTLIGGHNAY
ncbi:MAG: DNA repair protein [Firmicutes bacterium]|nr:DNA repair protein [Bacillota bacterium]